MTRNPLRWFFAAVWIGNGLICKILDLVPRHRAIVAKILGEEHALLLTKLIGFAELGMAAWILSAIRPRWCAVVQIAAVATMNLIEFLVTPDLLLFGRWNALAALAYILLVWYDTRRNSIGHPEAIP